MNTYGSLHVSTPSDHEIKLTRVLNAPRELVYDAYTKPELVKRWLSGPDGWTMTVCEIDLRVGGKYRYVWAHTAGHSMGMGGEYREIVPPERLVTTEKFDQSWYPGEAIGTVTFEEHSGKTTVNTIIRYNTKEARDGVLQSPMAVGMEAGFARLEKFLQTLVAK